MAEVHMRCEHCEFDQLETTEFFDAFAYEEKSMDYHDGPLAGWMACKSCGRWFAFDCATLVETMLWHWTLVPAEKCGDPRDAIAASARDPEGWWLSVVEDRRGEGQRYRAVQIQNKVAKPVGRKP
jgi:hypothetical protein